MQILNVSVCPDNGKKGFSLAEALITLMIISLVVLLSVHSLAKNKKFSKNKLTEHYWECKIDETGAHKAVSDVPSTIKQDSSERCVFVTPKNVNRFYVTVVGGGGGGASGKRAQDPIVMTSGSVNFVPPRTQDYHVILVGGGGGGGGKNCNKTSSQGGGSGAVISGKIKLYAGKVYRLTVGEGAVARGKTKSGQPGQDSTLVGGGLNLKAQGGRGGNSRSRGGGCKWRSGNGKGGVPSGAPASMMANGEMALGGEGRANSPIPGRVCKSSNNCILGIHTLLGPQYAKTTLGAGGPGSGRDDHHDTSGYAGIIMVALNEFYGGDGGQAGATSAYEYNRSPGKEVQVIVGKGGKGALTENMDGEPGGASNFADRVIASGGAGGKRHFMTEVTPDGNIAKGGKGVPSSGVLKPETVVYAHGGYNEKEGYDGDKALENSNGNGGGGGAGGILEWGKGGDGSPGIVRVTW